MPKKAGYKKKKKKKPTPSGKKTWGGRYPRK
jgi:hypothetical protein